MLDFEGTFLFCFPRNNEALSIRTHNAVLHILCEGLSASELSPSLTAKLLTKPVPMPSKLNQVIKNSDCEQEQKGELPGQ